MLLFHVHKLPTFVCGGKSCFGNSVRYVLDVSSSGDSWPLSSSVETRLFPEIDSWFFGATSLTSFEYWRNPSPRF